MENNKQFLRILPVFCTCKILHQSLFSIWDHLYYLNDLAKPQFINTWSMLQDMSKEPPAQELVAKDLHGHEWHFRHIYRGT